VSSDGVFEVYFAFDTLDTMEVVLCVRMNCILVFLSANKKTTNDDLDAPLEHEDSISRTARSPLAVKETPPFPGHFTPTPPGSLSEFSQPFLHPSSSGEPSVSNLKETRAVRSALQNDTP
jgi:hypothetical protein